MDDIHIKKYTDDPEFQGCIEPEDQSWCLLVDKQGFPRLLVKTIVATADGQQRGFVAVDDLLPMTIPEIMTRGL